MLPDFFRDVLPENIMPEAEKWWISLSSDTQIEIINFYESDVHGISDSVDDVSNNYLQNEERLYLTAEEISSLEEYDFPRKEFYEYLVNHEVFVDLSKRPWHICRSEKSLRKYLALGILPKNFTCPLSNASCPMIMKNTTSDQGYWILRIIKKAK